MLPPYDALSALFLRLNEGWRAEISQGVGGGDAGFQWGGETGNRRQGGTEHRVLAEVWRYRSDKFEGGETAGEGTEGEVEGRAGTGDRQIFPY